MSDGNGWLTPKRVANMCGASMSWLTQRRMKRKPPPFYKIGGKVLYKREEVEAWIASARNEPA
jgi:predicted DNA-binding transcriptional regulator AlpA